MYSLAVAPSSSSGDVWVPWVSGKTKSRQNLLLGKGPSLHTLRLWTQQFGACRWEVSYMEKVEEGKR